MKKRTIIIIPFSTAWDWSADYQRQTCLELARRGFTVIAYMINTSSFFLFKGKKTYPSIKNIHFVSPSYLLPFRRLPIIEYLNQRLSFLLTICKAKRRSSKVIVWLFDPYFYWMANKIGSRSTTLYDCVDYQAAGPLATPQTNKDEKKLIAAVDYFFTNSFALQSLHKERQATIVPQGFAMEELKKYGAEKKVPQNSITIGYIGGINQRIDFKLLFILAQKHPDYIWKLCGPIQHHQLWSTEQKKYYEKFQLLPNVTFLTHTNRTKMVAVLKTFTIGIIPYLMSQKFNRFSFPMKLFEYFYIGIPVISTPIMELARFSSYVRMGTTAVEWGNHLQDLTSQIWPNSLKIQQRKLAIDNSWQNKITAILNTINHE